jgi:hypothetical protein
MSVLTIESIVQSAEAYGLLDLNQISGCTDEEIRAILKDQDVDYIPEQVRIFYQTLGKSAGSLFIGEYILFPGVLGNKTDYLKALSDMGLDNEDLKNALVFLNHQGYQFNLCLLGKRDEAIYSYEEGATSLSFEAASFFEFLDDEIRRIYDLRVQRRGLSLSRRVGSAHRPSIHPNKF